MHGLRGSAVGRSKGHCQAAERDFYSNINLPL